ncbi:MAG: GNAT family N-acetyltransferase [Chloroflexota bacterium]
MTPEDLEAFIDEEVFDYARERELDGTWSRRDSLERAREALLPVITWERQAATAERQLLLTAKTSAGQPVAWLWVKLGPPGPRAKTAFLCQVTVARSRRHQGIGRAVLTALEATLADAGICELVLNVWESNLPAKCLYEHAGYECGVRFDTMRQFRKRLIAEIDAAAAPDSRETPLAS